MIQPKEIINSENSAKVDEHSHLFEEDLNQKAPELTNEKLQLLEEISSKISSGANIFLLMEYLYLSIFICIFSLLIYFVAEAISGTYYTCIAFAVGAITSILCGYIGMVIATRSNYKTCYKA